MQENSIKTRLKEGLKELRLTIYEYFLLTCFVCVFFFFYGLVGSFLEWRYWLSQWGGFEGIWISIQLFLQNFYPSSAELEVAAQIKANAAMEKAKIAFNKMLQQFAQEAAYLEELAKIFEKHEQHLAEQALLKEQAEAAQLWYKQVGAAILLSLTVIGGFYSILKFGVDPEWMAMLSSFFIDPYNMLNILTTWILNLPDNHAFWDYLKNNKEVLQLLFEMLTNLKNTIDFTEIDLITLEECLKKLSELFDN